MKEPRYSLIYIFVIHYGDELSLQRRKVIHQRFLPTLIIKADLMYYMTFDRELCSKVLKEALLFFLLLLLAWHQVQQMEQKMFANKMCSTTNKIVSNGNKILTE